MLRQLRLRLSPIITHTHQAPQKSSIEASARTTKVVT